MGESLKIMRLITRLNIGGPAQHVIHLNKALKRMGYRTLLVAGRVEAHEGDLSHLCRERGVELVEISQMARPIRPLGDLIAFLRIAALLRREKPAILHTHTSKAGFLGRIAALFFPRIAVFHTFHGHVFSGYFGPLQTRLFILMERFLARFTRAIIAVGAAVKEDLIRFRIAPREKIHVVPPGLDLAPYLESGGSRTQFRNAYRFQESDYLIGLVGRMVPIKGHAVLLEAAKDILKKLPHARFVFIGDGASKGSLLRQAEELGISHCTHFVGFQKRMSQVYAGLDLVVIPSLNEGFPSVSIEALACGLPVVATRVGSIEEIVEGDFAGILVPPGNPRALADAVVRAAESEKGPHLSKKRKKLALKYNVETLTEKILSLYERYGGICEMEFTREASFKKA